MSTARRLVLSVALLPSLALARGGAITTRVSVSSTGVQANNGSQNGALDGDGRFVAFQSAASNLVASDTNGTSDIFVRDRTLGTTVRASVSTGGAQANGASILPAISGDGRRVAFSSAATNLVAGDTNSQDDIFVRDLVAGTTVRVNVDSFGVQSNGTTQRPRLSFDGSRIVFSSDATNLVASDTNNRRDVFVHDLVTGTTEMASLAPGGALANNSSQSPSISGDGRYVAFDSFATNLVAGDTNGFPDVFVFEIATQNTTIISRSFTGGSSNQGSLEPSLSFDGQFVVFYSSASNLVATETNGASDVFVATGGGGGAILVSVATGGVQGNNASTFCSISSDGRYVAFDSFASNFTIGDTNANRDVFVRDIVAGTTECASLLLTGVPGPNIATGPAISGDGRDVLFYSSAAGYVAGDTNGSNDVFAVDLDGTPQPVAYCTAGTTTSNCTPALTSTGTPRVGASSGFALVVDATEGSKTGLFFYGTSGRAAAPWGTGTSFLCVKSPTQRTSNQISGGATGVCNGFMTLDWSAFVASHPSSVGAPFSAGDVVDAQAWFRDPPAPKSTNLTSALEFVISP